MGLTVKNNSRLAVKEEVAEGTYVAPATGVDFIQTLDSLEINPASETNERAVLGGGLSKPTPRVGTSAVQGSVGIEMKAGSTEGAAPETDLLFRSALGGKRAVATKTTSDADGGTYTTSKLCLANGDAAGYAKGDIVVIKKAGAYHTSAIKAVGTAAGDNHIELEVPMDAPAVDGLVISPSTVYHTADDGHPSLSISKFLENKVLESATGMRVTSMALNNFATGQLADFSFGMEGIAYNRAVQANAITPTFDSSFPPTILRACLFVNGVEVPAAEFSFSVENTVGFTSTLCSATGRDKGRISARSITGSMTIQKPDDAVDWFTRFKNMQEFSVFVSAHNPTGVDGEYEQVVGFWLPHCLVTELAEGDQDGILMDQVSFSAGGGANAETELFIGFI